MKKEEYIYKADTNLTGNAKEIMKIQIDTYYKVKRYVLPKHDYKIGDNVFLKEGTLLHGIYQNIDGLEKISKDGLISTLFVSTGRFGKYPACVGVWKLQKDTYLKEYINFYSGGYFKGRGYENDFRKDIILSYDELHYHLDKYINDKKIFSWNIEQTKEARFLPNISQDIVQIGIIFNTNNTLIKKLLKYDILDANNINDQDVKEFVNPEYYQTFIQQRLHKDIFFTNRESAVLFGIPANFIEGVLVGRIYEKDKNKLKKIKELLPNCYICNLDGKVIMD